MKDTSNRVFPNRNTMRALGRSRIALGPAAGIVIILGMARPARAQSYPGPTLGSGNIWVDPVASDFYGPDNGHCSLTGAMNQATQGVLDPGCANDNQYYGGGPGGWTEIDLESDVYLGAQQTFFISNTSVSIVYTGDSNACQPTCTGLATIHGMASPYVGFEVGYGGGLFLGNIAVTGYNATTFLLDDSTSELALFGTLVSSNDGQDAINQTAGVWNAGGGIVDIYYSRIENNVGGIKGAAVYNEGGSITISNSSITGNSVDQYGGGIMNYNGQVSLFMVSVGDNQQNGGSDLGGGGIYQTGPNATMDINWSTITANTANGAGPGIDNAGGTIAMRNSILADNGNGSLPDCNGVITSGGYNLLGYCPQATTPPAGRPDTSTFFSADETAMLSPLSAPTTASSPRYYIPRAGSPAINAIPGADPDCQASVGNSTCDIGAYQNGD